MILKPPPSKNKTMKERERDYMPTKTYYQDMSGAIYLVHEDGTLEEIMSREEVLAQMKASINTQASESESE